MSNITNIAEKLKNAPKGTELYSPIFGECTLKSVSEAYIEVEMVQFNNIMYSFNIYGQKYNNGECLLFPSKEVRDWSNFSIKKEEKYDFKPFDKVIV